MTDEELAKGWVIDNTGFNPKEPLGKIAIRTFLAGLEAGKDMAEADLATIAYMQGAERYKLKWHDLRKDPNDLPNGYRVVLNQVGMPTNYDPNRGFLGFGGAGIIAWCEIPIFTDKK